MREAVSHDRLGDPSPSRLTRVRCIHCHMPTGVAHTRCWSCGADPTGQDGVGGLPDPFTRNGRMRPAWQAALLTAAATALILMAVVGTVMMFSPGERSRGLRGLAARVHGGSWERTGLGGITAEFPSRPERSTTSPLPGQARPTELLVASSAGLRVELRATPLLQPVSPASLIDSYSAATGQEIRHSAPVVVSGLPSADAVTDGPLGPTWLRALVTASFAYLLAVTGPEEVFERVARSLAPAA